MSESKITSFEECRKELLNYKFDEVLNFYEEDFGDDIAEEIENKIVSEIGEDNPCYHNLLEERIIRLWYELINKVIYKLLMSLESKKTIDFSDIIIELKDLRKKAKDNSIDFYILKEIYFDDIGKIKFRIKSRLDVAKNNRIVRSEEKHKGTIHDILLGAATLILGYILSKFF